MSRLVTIAGKPAALTAAQRTFNKLTEQIEAQRLVAAGWSAFESRFHQRMSGEYSPAVRKMRIAQRRLLVQLDEILQQPARGERLPKSWHDGLRILLQSIARDILSDDADAEVSELLARNSDADRELGPRKTRRTQDAPSAADFEDFDYAPEPEQPAAETHEPTSRERKAAERKRQAEQQSKQSVREVFRKLVSSLHPDRETDPAEHARKTEMMKRLNLAYQSNDLLSLLGLQLELAQLDAAALTALPDARLKQFNQALREQLQSLKLELSERIESYHAMLSVPRGTRTQRPSDVDWLINQRIAEIRQMAALLVLDSAGLEKPARRRATVEAMLGALFGR